MYKDIHFKILATLCLVTVSISLGFAMADNQIAPIRNTEWRPTTPYPLGSQIYGF